MATKLKTTRATTYFLLMSHSYCSLSLTLNQDAEPDKSLG